MLLLAQPTLAAAGLVVLWLLALLIARYCGQPPPLQQRFERYLAYYESRAADWSGAAPPSGGKERARVHAGRAQPAPNALAAALDAA